MQQVPFFDYKRLYRRNRKIYLEVIDNVLSRGAFILQSDVAQFESRLAQYVGAKHAIAVADGTMALYLSLRSAGIGAGDEVIVSTHTFIATCSAIVAVGAVPVPVDCTSDLMMSPDSATQAVTSATQAIMPTQLNGRTMRMEPIQAFAQDHGLSILEDSCQGLGSRYKDRMAGTFGHAGTYSFYPAKVLGTFGDAGALVTDSDDTAEAVRQMRDHGRDLDGFIRCWGVNGRMDNLHAAVLLEKMKGLDAAIEKRRLLAAVYQERLGHIAGLELPPGPISDSAHYDTFQNYEVQASRRNDLQDYLKGRGVGTIRQWGGRMVHHFPELRLKANAPYADRLATRMLLLPLNDMLDVADVEYVSDAIRTFYED